MNQLTNNQKASIETIKEYFLGYGIELSQQQAEAIYELDISFHVAGFPNFAYSLPPALLRLNKADDCPQEKAND